ncbi:MAG TPA: hypothetical protein VGK17_03020 [Propionicimonas sp.]|jgi:hypothetical protein
MKRLTTLAAAIAVAAGLLFGAIPSQAVAEDSPTPTPSATPTPTPTETTEPPLVVIRTPWVKTLDQWCEASDATNFYFGDGALFAKRVSTGVIHRTLNESGKDVTGSELVLPVGSYVTTFTAPEGSVFESGEATAISQSIIFSADPCGKPATKVKRGAWHIVKITAHYVKMRRTVKTTRYHAVMNDDGMAGEWVARTSVAHQSMKVKI